jgi:hypothetical protein
MGVIHDPPYRPTKGKFRIIAEGPGNIGLGALQMLVAKMKGKWADRSTVAGVGLVARLCCRNSGCFLPDRSGPGAILTICRRFGQVAGSGESEEGHSEPPVPTRHRRGTNRCVLKLQHRTQTFIHQALHARRQHTGLPGQETAIESQELGDVDDRVARQARQLCRQQHVAWGIGKLCVSGNHCHDYRLNTAAVEGICLDNKHWPSVTRLGATRFGKVGPPDPSSSNLLRFYHESLSRDLN